MGSGSSKKVRHVSTSDLLQLNKKHLKEVQSTRSVSVPSYLASFGKKSSKDEIFRHGNRSDVFQPQINNYSCKSEPKILSKTPKEDSDNSVFSPENMTSVIEAVPSPHRVDTDGSVVNDTTRWTLTELYNILIAESWLGNLQLNNPSYLLLLDCRSMDSYNNGHIITARHHTSLEKEFGCLLHVPGQLEAFGMIVVYGDQGDISSVLKNRNVEFYALNLPFEAFSSKYPFLCTTEAVNNSVKGKQITKTWPSEILDNKIYQGNAKHALDSSILQALSITHIINVTLEHPNAYPDTIKYLRIQLDDQASVDLLSWLPKTTKFIAKAINESCKVSPGLEQTHPSKTKLSKKSNRILIHCNLGRSRSSTVVLGYLMEAMRWSLKDAGEWLKDCRPTAKPNVGFLDQLLLYENRLFGRQISDFSQLPF